MQPTDEQQRVINDPSRIRVVQAAPGSGKTWLIAEIIRRELQEWNEPHAGIAALSFTNVGGDEIRIATGYELGHPHFVGTIDAFLFRYVLRPFLKKLKPNIPEPTLIPAAWKPNLWKKNGNGANFTVDIPVSTTRRQTISLLDTHVLRVEGQEPVFGYKISARAEMTIAEGRIASIIHAAKKRLWESHGLVTHSDAAYISSRVLQPHKHAKSVLDEITRRFPYLVVDELQDTGWCHGQCVRALLGNTSVRGLLVGDPDQAIYEFNGATPELFSEFGQLSDATILTLGRSQRCTPEVCRVARSLSGSGSEVNSDLDRTSRTIMLTYKNLESDIERLVEHLDSNSNAKIAKVIARKNAVVDKVSGRSGKSLTGCGSRPATLLHQSVLAFNEKSNSAALKIAETALACAIFGCYHLSNIELESRGVALGDWRKLCIKILLEASGQVEGETIGDWWERMKEFVHAESDSLLSEWECAINNRVFKKPQKHCEEKRSAFLSGVSRMLKTSRVQFNNIHGVKGETHDLTVFVCVVDSYNPCPSIAWWPDNTEAQEERRIAFVATTRTRGDLIVCVPQKALVNLKAKRPEFIQCFEIVSIEEFLKLSVPEDSLLS